MPKAILKLRALSRRLRVYLANAATDLSVMAFGFTSGVLIARGLGPHGRGQLAAAMMWPTLAATLVCFGLQHAFAYAVAAGWCSDRRLNEFAVRYTVLVALPTAILFSLASPFLFARSFPGETWKPAIFALSIPVSTYASFLMSIYQGRGDFRRWNRAKMIRNGGWALTVALLLLLGAATVVTLLIAQIAILFVLALFLAAGLHRAAEEQDPRPVPVKKLFRYGIAIYLSGIAYMVNQQLDQLLLSLWVSPAQLGQYAAAVTASGLLLVVSGAIGPVVFRRMVRERENPALQAGVIKESLWLCCLAIIPFAAVLTLLAPKIIWILYGDAFAEAGLLLRVMAPAVVFLGIGEILATALRASGRPMLATYGILGGVLVTVPGLIYALPRYGVWGAAWVSFIAYAAMAVCQAVLVVNQVRGQVVFAVPGDPPGQRSDDDACAAAQLSSIK